MKPYKSFFHLLVVQFQLRFGFGLIVSQFAWEASLDPSSGIAQSKETSSVFVEALSLSSAERLHLYQASKEFVSSWANFLCKKSLTLGLFQSKFDPVDQTSSLQLRYLPISLLTFGSLQQGSSSNTWILPIVRGILSLPNSKHFSPLGSDRNRGHLEFRLDVIPETSGHRIDLESKIVDYRPWLAGEKIPTSRLRKWLYLKSQVFVHAYVTWRFHALWRKILIHAASSAKDEKENTKKDDWIAKFQFCLWGRWNDQDPDIHLHHPSF